MVMFEIFKILRWHKKVFENTTYTEQLNKVREEVREYNVAFDEYVKAKSKFKRIYTKANVDGELTDIIIASINCMRYPEIRDRVKAKMSENKHRTFKHNHHI